MSNVKNTGHRNRGNKSVETRKIVVWLPEYYCHRSGFNNHEVYTWSTQTCEIARVGTCTSIGCCYGLLEQSILLAICRREIDSTGRGDEDMSGGYISGASHRSSSMRNREYKIDGIIISNQSTEWPSALSRINSETASNGVDCLGLRCFAITAVQTIGDRVVTTQDAYGTRLRLWCNISCKCHRRREWQSLARGWNKRHVFKCDHVRSSHLDACEMNRAEKETMVQSRRGRHGRTINSSRVS